MTDLNKMREKIEVSLKEYEDLAKKEGERKVKYIIAQGLRLYRAANRLTQDQLAKKLDINRIQVIRWEQGHSNPRKWVMELLEKHKIIDKGLLMESDSKE